MSEADKIKNAAQKAVGRLKESAGKIAGDKSLEAEGKTDQAKASLKQAGEHVKDVCKK
ncbi:CsbD family protein [Cryobacterium tagatosivorans]|uniref:CsbD family protein n=1 Tax=Cryobacterium tagatosivorans TaxID=1259199 RepID=A0A4R8UB96_9MICO|nr:CsbD family protein [Cryobacterium tagatosivorans]TFB48139.1 CsbD family protein [Cryobacterium tagatosivorans]